MSDKIMMCLDSTRPLTMRVPINPKTGQPWSERHNELVNLATVMRYDGSEGLREDARTEYKRLTDGIEMREVPYFAAYWVAGGALAGVPESKRDENGIIAPSGYTCHPDVFAGMTEEARAKFEIFDQDAFRSSLP